MWERYFSNIYVLALPERRAYIEGVMAAICVPKANYIQSHAPRHTPFGAMSAGEYNTWAGHVAAMKDFLASDGTRMLVFEDDIKAADVLTPERLDLMQYVPSGAVVYLGRCWAHCWLDSPVAPGLVRTRQSSCMHAVSLGRAAAEEYVATPPYAPSDDILQDLIRAGIVQGYAFQPGLFYQNQTLFHTTSGTARPDRVTSDCKFDYGPYIYFAVVAMLCITFIYMTRYILSIANT